MVATARILLVAVSLSLVLAACGKSPEERAAEAAIKASTGADASVERDDDATKLTIQTEQGAMTVHSGEGLSLPADFPGDVYLPSGYKVQNVTQIGPLTSLVLGLSGQSQALARDISAKMQAAGWTTAMAMQSGDQSAMLSFSKDQRSVTYSLAPAQEAGQLTLAVQHATEAD